MRPHRLPTRICSKRVATLDTHKAATHNTHKTATHVARPVSYRAQRSPESAPQRQTITLLIPRWCPPLHPTPRARAPCPGRARRVSSGPSRARSEPSCNLLNPQPYPARAHHAQVEHAAVHQVHHAPGRAHRHVHAAAQLPDLRPDVRACVPAAANQPTPQRCLARASDSSPCHASAVASSGLQFDARAGAPAVAHRPGSHVLPPSSVACHIPRASPGLFSDTAPTRCCEAADGAPRLRPHRSSTTRASHRPATRAAPEALIP
jgi:hypothetical protein